MDLTTINVAAVTTMSSREIAELVEKRHDVTKLSMERLAEKGIICLPPLVEYLDSLGRPATEYRIGKRDSYIVVAQLSPEFTARLVDRWQELESKQPKFDPSTLTRIDILKLALESEHGRIKAEAEVLALTTVVEQQKPAVEFMVDYVAATGLKGFRQVAKLLGVKETVFRPFLTDNQIMYRLGGSWAAYQPHLDAGRFVPKAGVSRTTGHAFEDHLFTPKGIAWIAELLSKRLPQALMRRPFSGDAPSAGAIH